MQPWILTDASIQTDSHGRESVAVCDFVGEWIAVPQNVASHTFRGYSFFCFGFLVFGVRGLRTLTGGISIPYCFQNIRWKVL